MDSRYLGVRANSLGMGVVVMRFRNPMANALNHGSAGEGVRHWWAQRLSAILLAVLTVWSVYAVSVLSGSDFATAREWLGAPSNAALGTLFILAALYHASLGLQVVIEDYIHHRATEIVLLVAIKLAALFGGLLALFSMFQIAMGV